MPVKEKTDAKYVEALGKRKCSVARVRAAFSSKPSIVVNEKDLASYFATEELATLATLPLKVFVSDKKTAITIMVKGGGIHSQAEAIRHGIANALIKLEPESKKVVKKEGFLTRDARIKERRKFGLKKARKAPQWSKR